MNTVQSTYNGYRATRLRASVNPPGSITVSAWAFVMSRICSRRVGQSPLTNIMPSPLVFYSNPARS